MSHIGMGHYVGLQAIPTPHGVDQVWFESFNEQSHLVDLAVTTRAGAVVTQPCRLQWQFTQGIREHTPDFAWEDRAGRRILVDVTRSKKLADPAAMAVFALTSLTAAAMGWSYQLRTELPRQRVRNLRFLWPWLLEEPVELTATHQADGLALAEVARALGEGPVGLSAVWRAIASGQLWINLNRPIDADTTVFAAPQLEATPWLVKL